jgi:hypothetical protein
MIHPNHLATTESPMRPYTVAYSDKTFFLSLKEDNAMFTLGLKDESKDFGGVQVMFIPSTNTDHEILRNALLNGVQAFNDAFKSAVTPMTEEEKELTLEMNY